MGQTLPLNKGLHLRQLSVARFLCLCVFWGCQLEVASTPHAYFPAGDLIPSPPGPNPAHPHLVNETQLPLSAKDGQIRTKQGNPFKLACVNWYGAHMELFSVGGLQKKPLFDLVSKIAELGFNCIRLPFSLELWFSDPTVPTSALAANPSLIGLSGMQLLDVVIQAATSQGLIILLNNHNSKAGWCCDRFSSDGLWHSEQYPVDMWLDALRGITTRYSERHPLVLAFDIRNEVHDVLSRRTHKILKRATWGETQDNTTDWRVASTLAAQAIYEANPSMLVFVSGLCFSYDLRALAASPPMMTDPSRLVWTTHAYPWMHWWVAVESAGINWKHVRTQSIVALVLAWFLFLPLVLWLRRNARRKQQVKAIHCGHAYSPGVLICSAGLWLLILGGGLYFVTSSYEHNLQQAACSASAVGFAKYIIISVVLLAVGSTCIILGALYTVLGRSQKLEHRQSMNRGHLEDVVDDGPGETDVLAPAGFDASLVDSVECKQSTSGAQALSCFLLNIAIFLVMVGALSVYLIWLANSTFTYGIVHGELKAKWALRSLSSGIPLHVGEFGAAAPGDYSGWWPRFIRFMKQEDLSFSYWPLNGLKWKNNTQVWEDESYGILDSDYAKVRNLEMTRDLQGLQDFQIDRLG